MQKKSEVIKLHLGKMSFAEVAEWRGVTEKNFIRNYNSRMKKELEKYCKFERYKEGRKYAGIEVLEIFDEEKVIYVKKGSKDYERMKKFIPDHVRRNPEITTGIWIAIDYLDHFPDCKLKKTTLAAYAREICKVYYGDGKNVLQGIQGFSRQVPGVSNNSKPRKLTDEERAFRRELFVKIVVDPKIKSIEKLKQDGTLEVAMDDLVEVINSKEGSLEEARWKLSKYTDFNIEEAIVEWYGACLEAFEGYAIIGKEYEEKMGRFVKEGKFNFNEDAE